ncbi:MAG: gamma-glutamyltransferase family protein [Acidimicrobiales bacterium]|nr:gamma-glutamyltransferase family protein [Acidimicrobiales bacterium]
MASQSGVTRRARRLLVAVALFAAACSSSTTAPSGTIAIANDATTAATSTVPPTTPSTATLSPTTAMADAVPALVAAAHPLATDAGLAVLEQGGSAIDATIAIQAVLGLVEPQSSGLAGGAFLLYFDAETGAITAYDGREEAPAGADPELLLDEAGEPLPFFDAVNSGRSVGVPGVVAMLARAHEDHGTAPWATNFDAAKRLATDGFEVSPRMADSIAQRIAFAPSDDFRALFLNTDGEAPAEGDVFTNPDYAATLQGVSEDWREFYSGNLPTMIVEAVAAEPRPGALTEDDFASYEARVLEALCLPYREYRVCGAPPPTSGGVGVLSWLGQLEAFDMEALGPTAKGWHHFIEAGRRAYADRGLYLADDRFVAVPVPELLDPGYLAERSATIDPTQASATVEPGVIAGFDPGADATEEASGTSHFVVRDTTGNVVTMTTSVEFSFGSGRVAGGMVLNNQLTDFSFQPIDDDGAPVANAPAPGKRPRSSMAPTLVLDADGNVIYALGSPGGPAIIAYVAKTLVGLLDWNLSPIEAVLLPNIVPSGETVRIEQGADPGLAPELEAFGHVLATDTAEISGLHVLAVGPDGSVMGAADPRREGTVATTG